MFNVKVVQAVYKIPHAKLNSSYYETAVYTGLTYTMLLLQIQNNNINRVWNI